MITTEDLFGNEHTILPCRAEDIDVHFSKISNVIPSEEVIQFKKRMSECLLAESAYTLSDGSCFLYYQNYKPCCAYGVALYGTGSPVKMLALLAGVFQEIDPVTFKLSFALHAKTFAKNYLSLITMTSLKRSRVPGHPLVVRIDELRSKLLRLYKMRGLK